MSRSAIFISNASVIWQKPILEILLFLQCIIIIIYWHATVFFFFFFFFFRSLFTSRASLSFFPSSRFSRKTLSAYVQCVYRPSPRLEFYTLLHRRSSTRRLPSQPPPRAPTTRLRVYTYMFFNWPRKGTHKKKKKKIYPTNFVLRPTSIGHCPGY